MAFLQSLTANLTPHPVPGAPLADEGGREGSVVVEQAATARFSFQLGGRGGASGAIVIVEILPVAFLASILQNSLDKKIAGKLCKRTDKT